MLAVAVELLTGRYIATAYNDRSQSEWPPHPARFFSALVATWANGEPGSPKWARERAALEWLERQAPPTIYASGRDDVAERDVVPVFVPVNDEAVVSPPSREKLDQASAREALVTDSKERSLLTREIQKLSKKLEDDTAKAIAKPARFGKDVAQGERLLPERRTKQPRTFPSITPRNPNFCLAWNDAEVPDAVEVGLRSLLSRLVRLGHSSSIVHARLVGTAERDAMATSATDYSFDQTNGELIVRWVSDGQVARLEKAFELHRETEPRVLPTRFCRYREGSATREPVLSQGVFESDFVVLARVGGPRLPITSIVGVSRQLRRALMAAVGGEVPELLSGHKSDGSPLDRPHLAVVPLPVVGNPHADGAILGVGLFLPREISDNERRAVLAALGLLEAQQQGDADPAVIPLRLGSAGVLELERVVWSSDMKTLQPWWWGRACRAWASATPVALDKNPGDLHDRDAGRRQRAFDAARDAIADAIVRQGLPTPVEIDVVRSCVLPGAAKPRTYPRYPAETQRPQRVLVHTRVVFKEQILGPLILGAGRFHGLGLHLPVDR